MSTVYVDEASGSDETGKGTQEQPYQTLAFAIFTHGNPKILSRKDPAATYEEPTQSALKKAKKGADGKKQLTIANMFKPAPAKPAAKKKQDSVVRITNTRGFGMFVCS